MPEATPKRLTLEQLKSWLDYCPDTGVFTWRCRRGRQAAGSIAGRPHKSEGGKLYWAVRVGGEQILAHRLAWFYVAGRWPSAEIDHEDGNGQNNSFVNLKEATRLSNSKNLSLHRKSRTGVTGVRPRPGGRFEAAIFCNGQHHHLGMHDTFDAAVAARRKAEQDLNFHPHHGNLPQSERRR
jgi:hypothetical protein